MVIYIIPNQYYDLGQNTYKKTNAYVHTYVQVMLMGNYFLAIGD